MHIHTLIHAHTGIAPNSPALLLHPFSWLHTLGMFIRDRLTAKPALLFTHLTDWARRSISTLTVDLLHPSKHAFALTTPGCLL